MLHGLCLHTFRWPHRPHLNWSVVACPASVPRWHSRFIFFSISSRSFRFSSVASSCQRTRTRMRSWPQVSGLGKCSEGRPARYSTLSHGIPCRMRSWLPAPGLPFRTSALKRTSVAASSASSEDERMSARSLLFVLRLKSICMRRVLRCMLSVRVVPRFAVPFGRAVTLICCMVCLRTKPSSRGSLLPFQVERHLPAATRHIARHGVET